ncbi:MAG: hypothetical protein IJC85_04680 [Oscillospiraceae bacterium]|nr:hypothetical protein [Oscillospiraceae bacterium]MBQ4102165.1 hypothetical protein [Oscillospiraceae bacterium]
MGWLKDLKEAKAIKKLYEHINDKHIAYATMRMPDGSEKIIGKEGSVNIKDGEILLRVGDTFAFRGDLDSVRIGQLMSLNGVTIQGYDKASGTQRSVIGYYEYHRK